MTAVTVHTHHAKIPDHPVLDHLADTADLVITGEAWLWAKYLARKVSAWTWLHFYGLVMTAVALTFVGGLVLTLAMSDNDASAILVALVGFPTITASIAYHWGGTP